MKKLLLFVITLSMVVLSACSRQAPELAQNSQEFSSVLSVQIENDFKREAVEAQYNGKVIAWYPENNLAVLGLYAGELSAQGDGNKDALVTPEASASGTRAWGGGNRAWGGGYRTWGGGNSTTPTTFGENVPMWQKIKLVEAQNVARNLGRGVKVAVIDSGIDLNHPAFAGKLAPQGEWKDFVDNDNLPQEVGSGNGFGHGTGVAGVILQVAPNATILPIRVLEADGTGDLDDVVAAIDWAIQKGAKVINLSLGSDVDLKAMRDMLKLIASHNIIAVASAGNNGQKNIEYPARHGAEVIGVGSVDKYDLKSDFSAYGKELDVMAPGEFVYTPYPNNQIAYWNGTSFAAPMVTGAVALVLAENSAAKAADAFKESVDTINEIALNRRYGKDLSGRLNIEAYVRKALTK